MKMTKEELLALLAPEIQKLIFEDEKVKGLFDERITDHLKEIDIFKKDNGTSETLFANTARFFQGLARGDQKVLGEIWEKERPKYIELFGGGEIGAKALTTLMTEGAAAYGGNLVPVEYYQNIFRIPVAYGIARRDCFVLPMTRASMKVPTATVLPTTYWTGENAAMTESRATLGQIDLATENQTCLIPFSFELLADATPPLIALLNQLTAEAMMAGEDDALFNGKGTSVGNIFGNASVKKVVMDGGRQSMADVLLDDLLEMIDIVDDGAEVGAKFYMNKLALKYLRKLKDENKQYILDPTGQKGIPPSLLGYPYELSPKITRTDGTDTAFIVFGNLKRSVIFGDRMAMTVDIGKEATISSTNLFVNNLLALRFVERLDIEIAIPSAISILATAS